MNTRSMGQTKEEEFFLVWDRISQIGISNCDVSDILSLASIVESSIFSDDWSIQFADRVTSSGIAKHIVSVYPNVSRERATAILCLASVLSSSRSQSSIIFSMPFSDAIVTRMATMVDDIPALTIAACTLVRFASYHSESRPGAIPRDPLASLTIIARALYPPSTSLTAAAPWPGSRAACPRQSGDDPDSDDDGCGEDDDMISENSEEYMASLLRVDSTESPSHEFPPYTGRPSTRCYRVYLWCAFARLCHWSRSRIQFFPDHIKDTLVFAMTTRERVPIWVRQGVLSMFRGFYLAPQSKLDMFKWLRSGGRKHLFDAAAGVPAMLGGPAFLSLASDLVYMSIADPDSSSVVTSTKFPLCEFGIVSADALSAIVELIRSESIEAGDSSTALPFLSSLAKALSCDRANVAAVAASCDALRAVQLVPPPTSTEELLTGFFLLFLLNELFIFSSEPRALANSMKYDLFGGVNNTFVALLASSVVATRDSIGEQNQTMAANGATICRAMRIIQAYREGDQKALAARTAHATANCGAAVECPPSVAGRTADDKGWRPVVVEGKIDWSALPLSPWDAHSRSRWVTKIVAGCVPVSTTLGLLFHVLGRIQQGAVIDSSSSNALARLHIPVEPSDDSPLDMSFVGPLVRYAKGLKGACPIVEPIATVLGSVPYVDIDLVVSIVEKS